MLPPGMQRLLGRQLMRFQERTSRLFQELKGLRLEGQAGGGAVRAVVSGLGELHAIHIDRGLLHPEGAELLEDLIVVAIRDAMRKAEETQQQKIRQLLGDIALGSFLGREGD